MLVVHARLRDTHFITERVYPLYMFRHLHSPRKLFCHPAHSFTTLKISLLQVITDGDDEAQLSRGVYDTYTGTNLRYSQVAPLSMFDEVRV